MKINNVNIGEEILKKVESSAMSKAEFAKRVGIARQNIDKTVFAKHSIDTDLLCRICEVLECNLFNYFQDSDVCNHLDNTHELKATLLIEMGTEKQDKSFQFVFGKNNIKIL